MNLFVEFEKEFYFESNAKYNQEDELLKLVDEVIENVKVHAEADGSTKANSPNAQVDRENIVTTSIQSSERMIIFLIIVVLKGEFN